METITLYTGNEQPIAKEMPIIIILTSHINDYALSHIQKQTGLEFVKCMGGYTAKPESSDQIVRLLLTYNYKTKYYDNWNYKNTLVLKNDYHTGFEVDSICYECAKHNHIHTNGMKEGERLAC